MPVRCLQKVLTVEEFIELKAEETMSPRGERRADARHGMLTWLIAATMGGRKNGAVDEFIPTWEPREERRQTVDEAVRAAMKITIMHGGTVN